MDPTTNSRNAYYVTEQLYEDDEDNDPYVGEVDANRVHIGFTAAAVMQLCRDIGVPIHIKWQNCKIESYTPEKSQYAALCIYIHGDHMFTVENETIRRAIAREQISTPQAPKPEILANMCRECPLHQQVNVGKRTLNYHRGISKITI